MTPIGLQTAPTPDGYISELLVTVGLPTQLANTVASGVVFVVVFVGVYLVSKLAIVPVVARLLDNRGVEEHVRKPLTLVVYGALLFVAAGLAFSLAGLGNILVALSTVTAAATLAVGFAMQDVIKNFVAGVFIYTDEPFRTGDWIEWEGNSGYVEDISLRVSRVRTFDNEHLTVPNSQLTDGVIKNYDTHGTLRLKFTFRVGFDEDLDRARDIVVEAAKAQDGVLDEPEPSVRLVELNDASFGLQSRIWIDDPGGSDFLRIRGQFVQRVSERFAAEGIKIPYPHRTVDGSLEQVDRSSPATSDD
ncbi:mechanosensitive ion channel family protein [Halobellus clavatus]|jgi:small-conductance mechanosensitive channel|uniref:Mechanosensitive ion channel n=1 Tax=Halobellus clavatus TaxID=660517 RepID=A0A1H3E399_9EURY|nr:mechanosensitive ion channel family protein [Halobellus clavatus]SDX73203.1 Mechanosensitive ion channel [Halobellus clavatus]